MAEAQDKLVRRHLDWSDRQRRILTAEFKADTFYTADRGFPFQESELPHYYLQHGDTRAIFREWATQKLENPIVGAWTRLYFCGGWDYSSDLMERSFNLQTKTLFIDIRIPHSRDLLFQNVESSSVSDLTNDQRRYYARQHIFAGYSRVDQHVEPFHASCTRHHCIDWNFVGVPRSRPNKWWIDMHENGNQWKEWAYATDNAGQHYYVEQWNRLEDDGGVVLALRKSNGQDGVLLVIGDHFSYCLDRSGVDKEKPVSNTPSLGALVDAAVDGSDAALLWLSMQGGHGRVSKGWILDCAIEYWKEGTPLWTDDDVHVEGDTIDYCRVMWLRESWEIVETNIKTPQDVDRLLKGTLNMHRRATKRRRR